MNKNIIPLLLAMSFCCRKQNEKKLKAQKEALEASQREQMKLMQEGRDREATRMNQVVSDMKNQMQTQLKNQQENERKTREHYDKLIKEISNRPPVVVESKNSKFFLIFFTKYRCYIM